MNRIISPSDFFTSLTTDFNRSSNHLYTLHRQPVLPYPVNKLVCSSGFRARLREEYDVPNLLQSGKLDPVIGRDEEIRRVLQILSRRTKNNPILIGEPGTGKSFFKFTFVLCAGNQCSHIQ